MRKFGMREKGAMIYGQRLLALVSILLGSTVQAFACDQPVVISNWSFCATGNVSAEGGAADWKVVPAWTREKAISAYFGNDPRLLANHGLCNAKFHRVVLCQPGWQTGNPDECSYLVCSGYYSSLFGKEEREAYERDFPAEQ
ncbi:hypothetical protein AMC83_CH00509 [Rhizobium phaseoli]|uniref:hypothetical protein n=1 Tax=Rhizobium phaseoli TaxID=396 RepID=UPI000495EE59|nr:hypothetical protein [Rhizobium phaseoli]ANL70544.1 hypothetical protein AMC83_CH00509 [Rhizobium phaseoli]KKZ87893.1 hypothetical protein RPHASCH2410_CH09210 [Rhizobium phaseoli Ch24-10]RDJ17418.1 hypothetical protein B5K04_04645 [Rhizobium phaseoli]RDJ18702.1 hypothetical protein B5K05_04660 [Rhizobium phaseoli]